jgi:hypothetical protein
MKLSTGLGAIALISAIGCSGNDDDDTGIRPANDSGTSDSGADAGPTDFGLGDSGEVPDSGVIPDSGADQDSGTTTADSGPGDPIVAPDRTWTWVPVPESRCINNQPTGFGVNLDSASTKLMIFLEGGNACFNEGSCAITANLDGYTANKFASDQYRGLPGFDRTATQNYFKDWSYVLIPYCTGDVYSGTVGTTRIEGTSYTFKGFDNVRLYLQRIVPTFPNVTEVVLTGVSAGGFGAFSNYDQVATAFGPNVKVTLIDDSGPPFEGTFVPGCLQQHFRTTWGIDEGPLAACGTDCTGSADGTFMIEYLEYMLEKYPNNNFGVISSSQDQTIRNFWGYGNNNCSDLLPGFLPPAYTGQRYQMGLESLRDNIFSTHQNAKLYMPSSTRHVWTSSPPWMINENGVVLQDWMIQTIEDNAAWGNVP